MTGNEITLWNPKEPIRIPGSVKEVKDIAQFAKQLTKREIQHVIAAFDSDNYEIGAMFLWSRTMAGLKKQLASLGMDFIGELLERPDINADSTATQVLTDYDAVDLAEELGMVTSIEGMRLRRVLEMVSFFAEPPKEDDDEEERQMMPEEAIECLRACIQSVLGHERLEGAVEFARFREELEEKNFTIDDPELQSLLALPYFFRRTTLRILLAMAKTATGAQLEHVLANTNIIIPALWKDLLKSDRWLVGRAYSDVHSEGRKTAAVGLRRVLLKVKGFDYVPEDLRSRTFITVASNVKTVHFSMDNFRNEPAAIAALTSLGTTIPSAAISHCMSAILCVRLGNHWGISWAAQDTANGLLRRLGEHRWRYYLDDCLPADETILGKLTDESMAKRWCEVVEENKLSELEVTKPKIRQLVRSGTSGNTGKVVSLAESILSNLTTGSS